MQCIVKPIEQTAILKEDTKPRNHSQYKYFRVYLKV